MFGFGWGAGGVPESPGTFSRLYEARIGNGFRVRDLDKYLMQLGKCLAENILPEE